MNCFFYYVSLFRVMFHSPMTVLIRNLLPPQIDRFVHFDHVQSIIIISSCSSRTNSFKIDNNIFFIFHCPRVSIPCIEPTTFCFSSSHYTHYEIVTSKLHSLYSRTNSSCVVSFWTLQWMSVVPFKSNKRILILLLKDTNELRYKLRAKALHREVSRSNEVLKRRNSVSIFQAVKYLNLSMQEHN